jgi:hypothetical protein
MKRRRLPNPRLIKIHRSYTIEEAARRCRVHRCTVRQWLKVGLVASDGLRPYLIRGSDLRAFLQARRTRNKRSCGPGEIYCVRCRSPKRPAGNMADYVPYTDTWGHLIDMCPDCELIIHRSVNIVRLPQVRGALAVAIPKAHSRIGETANLSLNTHLKTAEARHAKTHS